VYAALVAIMQCLATVGRLPLSVNELVDITSNAMTSTEFLQTTANF